MTAKQIKKLWFYCYGENLRTEYSGFYRKLKKLENENVQIKKTFKHRQQRQNN